MSSFRSLWLLVLVAMMPQPTSAATYVYVSEAAEKQIGVYRVASPDGKLEPVERTAVASAPGALTVDPTRTFLYASLRTSSEIAAFRIDPATGRLTLLGTAQLPPRKNASFLRVDQSGKFLYSASYTGGEVVVFRLDGGRIESAPLQTVKTANTAHCVTLDPTGRWAFVPHVAPNAVFQFRVDPATGLLTEAGRAAGGKPEAGPRHVAFHPTLARVYGSDERSSSITAYAFDPATGLKAEQTLSTLPPGFDKPNTTAEIKIHPNGKFAWVSNRGDDSLAGFAIDAAGKLTANGRAATEKTPRSFDLNAAGTLLFAAGEGSGKLAVYRIDAGNGHLDRVQTYDVAKSLTWCMVVDVDAK